MSLTDITPWEPFPIQSSSSPPLYIQRVFTTSSYSVYLSDLTSIWGETLDKSSILDRAEDRGCSIDPSADDSQLRILLEKLSSGITGVNSAATVELEVRRDSFNISTKEKLQAPLQPLEWLFRLKLLSQAQFTKHFSLPLLYLSSLLSRQTNSLLAVIDDKDATIGRLLDKLEECKVEINSIFPGYKKGRAAVGKAKGLTKFDKADWRTEVLSTEVNSSSSKDLVKATFRGLNRSEDKVEVRLPKPSELQWWIKITGKVTVKGEPEPDVPVQSTPRKPPKTVRLNTESDDEFQALRSSPIRERAAEAPLLPLFEGGSSNAYNTKEESSNAYQALNDETTEDEDDDLDAAPISQASRATTKSSQDKPRSANTAEEPSRSSRTLSKSPEPPKGKNTDDVSATAKRVEQHVGVLTAFGLDDDSTTSDSEGEPSKPPPKRGGIKKSIGGRKRREMDNNDEDELEDAGRRKKAAPEPSEPEPEPEPEPPKRLGRIKGTIGGKKSGGEATKRKEPEPDSDEEMADVGQEVAKPPPRKKEKTKSPPIEGMDEEAAQKRREELQKQLAAKAATKKKGRRF